MRMAAASACLVIGLLSRLRAVVAMPPMEAVPGFKINPMFTPCPKIDRVVEGCRRGLLATSTLGGVKMDLRNPKQKKHYEMCMLEKLQLTMRETMVWCEHKGSLARKMALCYEYVLRMEAPGISDDIMVEKIDRFQMCLERSEESSAGNGVHKPNGIYKPPPPNKRRRVTPSRDSLEDEFDDYHRYDERAVPSDSFYPRLEHGLGNETIANETKPLKNETIANEKKPQVASNKENGGR